MRTTAAILVGIALGMAAGRAGAQVAGPGGVRPIASPAAPAQGAGYAPYAVQAPAAIYPFGVLGRNYDGTVGSPYRLGSTNRYVLFGYFNSGEGPVLYTMPPNFENGFGPRLWPMHP